MCRLNACFNSFNATNINILFLRFLFLNRKKNFPYQRSGCDHKHLLRLLIFHFAQFQPPVRFFFQNADQFSYSDRLFMQSIGRQTGAG